MIVPYTSVHPEAAPRPLLNVRVGHTDFSVKALVDSGAVNTLFESWVARTGEVDIADSEERSIQIGPEGLVLVASFTTVQMEVAGLTWEAEVGFCDTIAAAFGLLGQESFFRYFEVDFRRADLVFEIRPLEE